MTDPADVTGLNGLEQLRHLLVDHPTGGIVELVGMRIDELVAGRVVFSLVPDERMTNPIGTIHGGIAATLLDSVLGCAVHSALPAGSSYTTADLHIHYTRAITIATGRITGVGELVHLGRRMATSTGTIIDEGGRVLAHGTTTCLVLPTAG